MAANELSKKVGLVAACQALQVSRATYYRGRQPQARKRRAASPRALSAEERQQVLAALNSPPFVDRAPQAVYATLLDQGVYLCSPRSMYRILASEKMVRERRDQVRRPNYAAPQLLATKPKQLWSWDITKLRGSRPYLYYFLYTMINVFHRHDLRA